METNKVILGDCLDVLKTLPENSVDSIVTDPPYELGFMGKSWDNTGIANNKDMWAECLRVLKPGGHLLAFSGTRTYHRMASAIEDAGFEVRDMIEWVYGSGFPKSLNVRLNIDKQCDIIKDICRKSPALIVTDNFIEAPHILNGEFFAIEPVAPSLQTQEQNVKYVVKNSSKRTVKSKTQGITIAEECVKDLLKESLVDKIKGDEALKTLLGKWLSSKEMDISANFAELIENLKLTILKKLETFPNYDTTLPTECVFAINATTTESIKECLITNTVDILKEINYKLHNGVGTALKPAHEPICMARKPLAEKTVAENCLKYGTGGINIDESRVKKEEGDRTEYGVSGITRKTGNVFGKQYGEIEFDGTQGRFPANLILESCEEVRECFPETKSGTGAIRKTTSWKMSSEPDGRMNTEYGDSGNASRFFKSIVYVPKASKSERNAGLDDLPDRKSELNSGGIGRQISVEKRIADGSENAPTMKNHHPTVKPIALMEYLIKMVTKPGGIVLDPFAGSGSTLVAAKQNGFQYIGIEMTEEYIPIIEARLKAIKKENTLF